MDLKAGTYSIGEHIVPASVVVVTAYRYPSMSIEGTATRPAFIKHGKKGLWMHRAAMHPETTAGSPPGPSDYICTKDA